MKHSVIKDYMIQILTFVLIYKLDYSKVSFDGALGILNTLECS